ncbi:DUF6586 family protein [Pseudomonas sp.]|uniref:DUF6586 family protein n=1 Tax=Pseudomonas sp. TaxID=306 RepID=UPI00272AF7AD|nr:DUF6586 family protein [Pseudomonas sp.]
MANEVYTRTNQAVHFARRAIDSWREAESSSALDAVTQARYHRSNALFHLYRGVLALIHEVADRYRWPAVEVRNVEAGLDAELIKRFPGPELAELHELASMPGTWLAELLSAWDELQAPPKPTESKPAEEDLIFTSGSASALPWGRKEAEHALVALQERLACYREGMVEW